MSRLDEFIDQINRQYRTPIIDRQFVESCHAHDQTTRNREHAEQQLAAARAAEQASETVLAAQAARLEPGLPVAELRGAARRVLDKHGPIPETTPGPASPRKPSIPRGERSLSGFWR